MKKILFLTESYPNTRKSATILCTHRVMERMVQDSECEVHCLCIQYDGERFEEELNKIHVHRFKDSCWHRMYYHCSIGKGLLSQKYFSLLMKLQKILTIPYYPCVHPIQFLLWKKAARILCQKNHFDIVIAEHHGYNTLMTGCYLKKAFQTMKFVAMLWDPVKGQIQTVKLPKAYTEKRINAQENILAVCADRIISTLSMKSYYDIHGDVAQNKRIYLDIPGVIAPDDEVQTDYLALLKPRYINIVYSGIIGAPQRDPIKFLEILNMQKEVDRINLIFFCKGVSSLEQERWRKVFKGEICIHDYIPLQELHTVYRHADYLLNVSDINANMTPSKIFEYMSYGKPIISTYTTDGDAAKRYLDEYPEACVIDQKEDILSNVLKLEKFLSYVHVPVSFEMVRNLFPMNTSEQFVEYIRCL